MNIAIESLTSCEAFAACDRFLREMEDSKKYPLLPEWVLASICQSGGLILGAYDQDLGRPPLCGCLIDLVARGSGYSSRFTLCEGVAKAERNRGIGYRLREREREICRHDGVELVTWTLDPLRSREAHFVFNKLGAVATDSREYGSRRPQDDRYWDSGRKRLTVEWWINSPRVSSVIDARRLPHHFRLGLDQMEVVTKTGLSEEGIRRLVSLNDTFTGDVLLVEIPVDVERSWQVAPEVVQDWRQKAESLFEELFAKGYIVSGFVHEGERSFHLLEREEKGTILRRGA